MSNEMNPAPKRKYLRAWIVMSLGLLLPLVYFVWRSSRESSTATTGTAHPVALAIGSIVIGLFLIALGFTGYLVVLFTHAFTFNFQRPVWNRLKPKVFIANFIVPLIAGIGVAVILSGLLSPLTHSLNLPGNMSFMLPFMVGIVGLQSLQMFILIWAPLEKEIIRRRLLALGVTKEQLNGGVYIGISNPAITSSAKRMWCIEEDVGMLWFTPQQLIYWGDGEQFGINREQLLQMERKTDAKSTTALSGTAHVILHVRLADGIERQMRLHTEGVWTIFGKRKASDGLAARISAWHGAVAAVPQ